MPEFTITVSDKVLAKLQVEVDRYNANSGATLTVKDWIDLHLKEVATAPDMAAATERLRKEAEQNANDALGVALRAERDRLLQEL